MIRILFLTGLIILIAGTSLAKDAAHTFKKVVLTDQF